MGKKNEKYGLYTNTGKKLSDLRFDNVQYFVEDRAWVKVGNLWGFINTEGVMLIKPSYEYAREFSEGMSAVLKYDYYGYVNKQGEEVILTLYDDAENFSEGLAAVKGQWEGGFPTYAFINKEGHTVIIPATKTEAIEWAHSFRNGLAVISKGKGRVGMIDKKAKK